LLFVVPPSGFKEIEIQKLIHAMMKKKSPIRMPSECIASKSVVWMPYYRIQFEYRRSEKDLIRKFGETAESETALNAMFCGCTRSESELFMLFRPNYLKYSTMTRSPESDEIVGPTSSTNLDEILSGFVKRLNEVEDALYKLRSMLNKRYMRIARMRILPMIPDLKEGERLSEKIAKLSALKNVLNMCLNLDEDTKSIKVLGNSTFYYPTLMAALKHGENEAERFIIIDLVKRGLILKRLNCDDALTQLCNNNDACKEALVKSVAHASLRT
jgi:hypothetical protein